MNQVEIVLEARATIGESPTWSPEESALYWIDVKEPALHRFADGADRSWRVSADIGAFALCPDRDGAIVALRDGIHRLDFATGSQQLLAPPPFDPALHRFNEGACDAQGRFWVGVMFDPLDPAPSPRPAGLQSFTVAGGLRPEPDHAELHNGMGWSPDGRLFYLAHSNAHIIHRYEVGSDGALGERDIFATLSGVEGLPDGAAVDREGFYWCAVHGGGRLRRFSPDGAHDRDLALPVSQPTMCAFAGEALDTLYVTSARGGLDAAALEREPHAGALLRLRPGVTGAPRRCTVA